MDLTAEKVNECMAASMTQAERSVAEEMLDRGELHVVEGITRRFALDPAKLEANRSSIRELLDQLDDRFKGPEGGWSFLQACVDKNGRQWGEHPDMEALFVMGIGLGMVELCFPRDIWEALPGGMPYYRIL